MAFGITKHDLKEWKQAVRRGELAFLTHYWIDDRFPHCKTVTKVGCSNKERLFLWGEKYGLRREWVHDRERYPHFDLLGERQREILKQEGQYEQLLKLEKKGG
ncbi:hypothetical protein [Evansella tamaricis]|uniref:Uncharacterized protein n=1 Tax=Evansella tamaricis TaxID=2069301 RepID=A0ABS6JFR4_9BACI|nr:hypothetical protein [Evansella tamaricis]MBU9712368.1 hypothetical protein [Evansella tamaricis]